MNKAELDFSTLNAQSAAPAYTSTFAYWLGVLSDPSAQVALDADEACAVMSYQYDSEEQAIDEDGLRGYPDIVPAVLHPVAPVTLALRWSPFPSAIAALSTPVHLHRAGYGKVLAVFRPVGSPSFSAESADQRHFLSLLQHCSARADRSKRWIFLTGSPGWSYTSEDFIAKSRKLRRLMTDFGFVACARTPGNASSGTGTSDR
jgi:hypothetical protein